ncbi:hypothetical protein KPC83_05325 [Collinsella sp. zg1085]|uniref:hypothetical protein n=1 Tax=Collinsella sp. zg1085 TaxID=2844380 RepID=UPI001C0DBF35|nr:hypothetical protein [Collinsella sp. zg1085]QWT17263.1 hypothetical protein KPC83_05325 [Collinsella sp. zg1085]
MKLAIAQIHMHIGDIDAISERIVKQARLAHEQGATVLCIPAPLFSGVVPGSLLEYDNFEHHLLLAFEDIAHELEPLGLACIIPAALAIEGVHMLELFLLKEGRVIPLRLTARLRRENTPMDLWAPPVFDLDDVRVALTVDAIHDIHEIQHDVDLIIQFQINPMRLEDPLSIGISGLSDTELVQLVQDEQLWLAHVAPVGAYDDVLYAGGSFILDHTGEPVAVAQSCREDLILHDIQPGIPQASHIPYKTPEWIHEELIWEGLCLSLRESVDAAGFSQVVLPLKAQLPHALLLDIAVQALGPRKVSGVYFKPQGIRTKTEQARAEREFAIIQQLAAAYHIQLHVLEGEPHNQEALQGLSMKQQVLMREAHMAHAFEQFARQRHMYMLSALTKTHAALIVEASVDPAYMAPLGDLSLVECMYVAQYRAHMRPVAPGRIESGKNIEQITNALVQRAVQVYGTNDKELKRIARLMKGLAPQEVLTVLHKHIDEGSSLDEVLSTPESYAEVSMLLHLVARGEAVRERLPLTPMFSTRPFSERSWPLHLNWVDLGRSGMPARRARDLAEAESKRFEELGSDAVERMQREVLDLMSSFFGISRDELQQMSEEAGAWGSHEDRARMEQQFRDALRQGQESPQRGSEQGVPMPHMGMVPFFSLN